LTAPTEILGVFARAPELGRVKTRLCPPFTADEAVRFHRSLVEDTLERLGTLKRPELSRVLLLSRPLLHAKDLDVPRGWTIGIQAQGDLGTRLAAFFDGAFRREARRVVVVGTDSPTLPFEIIEEAFEVLSEVDVTVGPAMDGGYYLLGTRVYLPELFQGISWGTEAVLRQTAEAIERGGLRQHLLVPWYDVDRPPDLERLREEIRYLRRVRPALVPRRTEASLPATEKS
jgi:rSAM/selenodomain-associated transferase 1